MLVVVAIVKMFLILQIIRVTAVTCTLKIHNVTIMVVVQELAAASVKVMSLQSLQKLSPSSGFPSPLPLKSLYSLNRSAIGTI